MYVNTIYLNVCIYLHLHKKYLEWTYLLPSNITQHKYSKTYHKDNVTAFNNVHKHIQLLLF